MARISSLVHRLRDWARALCRDVVALWIAARNPRTPLAAKIVAACVAAYALSPIDLIPDFIPALGYLDDAVLLPLGILVAVRLIPAPLMRDFRETAAQRQDRPVSCGGMIVVLGIWLAAVGFGLYMMLR